MFRIKRYIQPFALFILLTLLIKFLGAAAELMIPYLMEILLDDIVPAQDVSGIFRYGLLMLLCAAACLAAWGCARGIQNEH